MNMVREVIDTTTYEFDTNLLREFGQVAQASKTFDFDKESLGLLNGVRPSFTGVAAWLHENSKFMSTYAAIAEVSASIRTHPRHIMDTSRLMGVSKTFKREVQELVLDMKSGQLLQVSDELRSLAAKALEIVQQDSLASEDEIKEWANTLSKDCFGKHD